MSKTTHESDAPARAIADETRDARAALFFNMKMSENMRILTREQLLAQLAADITEDAYDDTRRMSGVTRDNARLRLQARARVILGDVIASLRTALDRECATWDESLRERYRDDA